MRWVGFYLFPKLVDDDPEIFTLSPIHRPPD
jgi:hypothetical protein